MCGIKGDFIKQTKLTQEFETEITNITPQISPSAAAFLFFILNE